MNEYKLHDIMTNEALGNDHSSNNEAEELEMCKAEGDVNVLDTILVHIGEFGRYQMFNYVLLCIPMVFNAFQSISYVFTTSPVVYRCNVTQCDSLTTQYSEPWVNFTIPSKGSDLDQCNRYVFEGVMDTYSSLPSSGYCAAEYFNSSRLEKCGKDLKFRDEEYTVSNEFGIFCSEEWKLNMAGTINNVGQFIGIPLGGLLADRYGRRTMLAYAGFLSSIMGIIRSFSQNYYMFLSFELLDMVVGSTLFPTAFLLAIELVGPQKRVAAATIITIFYSLGEALLGVLAGQFQNWRVLLRVLYIPAALQIFFMFLLPESVRWLLSQRRDDQAISILRKAARINRRELSDSSLQQLVDSNNKKLQEANESNYPIWKAFKRFTWRIVNCSFCWFTHTLVALGLSLNSVNLGGNKYNNFMLNGLVQVPGLILPLFIMNSLGRRTSLCGSMLVCALCMGATILFGKDGHATELTLFLIGKFAITCSFQVLYFFTSEIFPTNVRNSLLSLCSMIGRIGSMIAPQTPLLANYYQYAPQILFGAFALVSGCLTLLFPETANKSLPTTMDEASNLNSKSEGKREQEFDG
ncbi:organic cation transporter protein [Haematobia irritans]|uniref:organic cation transporter protein n=1 Tax=Haematobia irritans TaxID=7368 RepID=UPI003F4FC836